MYGHDAVGPVPSLYTKFVVCSAGCELVIHTQFSMETGVGIEFVFSGRLDVSC